ncbi:hypothetical protein NFI96_008352, partial [Prochilodus magdalenae]
MGGLFPLVEMSGSWKCLNSHSGYGQTGPQSHKPGYDSIASAVSGMMHITGPEDGDPVRPGVAMTDLATGLYTHGAVMAGLLQRQRTGRGLHIDCNLLSSQVACLTHIAANYLNAGKEARRWGTAHGSIVPYQIAWLISAEQVHSTLKGRWKPCRTFAPGRRLLYVNSEAAWDESDRGVVLLRRSVRIPAVLRSKHVRGFKTKDGYLVVASGNDQQFLKVCKVLDLSDLGENPKYKTNTLRVQRRKELLQLLSERCQNLVVVGVAQRITPLPAKFLDESTAEWLRRFEGTGVPCGPINTIQQVFSDPQ